jgi:hypothetical protein
MLKSFHNSTSGFYHDIDFIFESLFIRDIFKFPLHVSRNGKAAFDLPNLNVAILF